MAQTVCVVVGGADQRQLSSIAMDRNRLQKHIQRARIVLLSGKGFAVAEVARQAGVSRPAVWRWQVRYAEAGVEGLLRDKTRPPGTAKLARATVAQILALTCSEPPGQVTHWTGRAMAKAVGISLRSVQRIWDAHHLQPHRLRTFKRSNDPAFAEKVEDIVGLYMDRPMHTVVLSIDEKSQIQAFDRVQPGLPLKPGKCGTMTHDYKRISIGSLLATMTAPMAASQPRIEIVSEHRRAHDAAFRARVVEPSWQPGVVVRELARQHGICISIFYRWCRATAPPIAVSAVAAGILRELLSKQCHDREQAKQAGCRARDGRVRPLALRFHTQVMADFPERDLDLPALDEPAQDLGGILGQVGAEQSLRFEPAYGVTDEPLRRLSTRCARGIFDCSAH